MRNVVSDENQTDPAGSQVRAYLIPEMVGDTIAQEVRKDLIRIATGILDRGVEVGLQALNRPVYKGVGGVIEHLTDDFSAEPGVGAPLDLDQSRYAILSPLPSSPARISG